MLFASVATATPITLSFDTINPITRQHEVWLTLTFTEVSGGVSMAAALNPDSILGDGWAFDGVWLEGADGGKEMQWTWAELGSPVFAPGYSFNSLSGRWFYARWVGQWCEDCIEEPKGGEHAGPSCRDDEIVLRARFPPDKHVPEPGGLSLLLAGLAGFVWLRKK
jgi:hypothetical protein